MWGTINSGNSKNYQRERMFHKAVLGNDDIIYYIGGISPDRQKITGEYIFSPLSMSSIITFDRKKGEWGYIKTDFKNEDFYPSGRIYHSANLRKKQDGINSFKLGKGILVVYTEKLIRK